MICLNCDFWEKEPESDFSHFLHTSELPSYLFKPRGNCALEGLVTCYDEGCERFKDKLKEE